MPRVKHEVWDLKTLGGCPIFLVVGRQSRCISPVSGADVDVKAAGVFAAVNTVVLLVVLLLMRRL